MNYFIYTSHHRWKYFLRCDFISIVYTFYRRVQGSITSLVFVTLHEVCSLFLLSIICTELFLFSFGRHFESEFAMSCGWKNKPIWLANCRHVISRQANFSIHEGACSLKRLVQQICPWSLLPNIKPLSYEGAKLGSKKFCCATYLFARNRLYRWGNFAPGACRRSVLQE